MGREGPARIISIQPTIPEFILQQA